MYTVLDPFVSQSVCVSVSLCVSQLVSPSVRFFGQCNSCEITQQNFVKICSHFSHVHTHTKFWFVYFKREQRTLARIIVKYKISIMCIWLYPIFYYDFLSDCPSFVHGIGFCYAQHCQAMFEHGVYKLACIPKYFIKSSTERSCMIDIA